MQWKRRKPLWPLLASLSCLFVLALAAPQGWQHVENQWQRPTRSAAAQSPITGATPRAPLPEQPLPSQRDCNLDQLLGMRDLLQSILNQLPDISEQHATHDIWLPIRVSSADDRLAMLDHRPHREPSDQRNAAAERGAFADVLLEAVRESHSPVKPAPRIAMRDAAQGEQPQPEPPAIVQPVPPPPAAIRHRPTALIEQLEAYPADSPTSAWAQQALALVAQLTERGGAQAPDVGATLDQIAQLVVEANVPADEMTDVDARRKLQRSGQAIERRLAIWRALTAPSTPETELAINQTTAPTGEFIGVLGDIAALLGDERGGDDWREYLMLDRIAAAASEGASIDADGRGKLAHEALSRMSDPRLTEEQREFLTTEPFTNFRKQLRPWAAQPVDLDVLAALVERYESNRQGRYAAAIARIEQRLRWSADPRLQQLASHLTEHYRGANLRMAVTSDLLNRLMPKQKATVAPVREQIAGAKVRGRSRTTTQLRVRLLPDPDQWHFGLDAFGKVYSDTRSDTWPARVRNAAKFQYQARKEIVINQDGLLVAPTRAQAQGRNELLGVDSQLDPVPIFGYLLRDLARQKHRKSRPRALVEVKNKVARQARQRMDQEGNAKLGKLEQKFRDHVLAPIAQLALIAEPLEMYTTERRAVIHLRLANAQQLAAHTPRPFAPADSVMSLQLHETVLNNAMAGLKLDGRRMTIEQLFVFFAERFHQADAVPPDDLPRRAVVEFAARDAICVLCDGDRLELVLNIRELARGRDKIRNFAVHAHFRPVTDGLDVRLVRDGSLQFAGRRLKTGPRVVLHSVLGKVLAKDQEFRLLAANLGDDPRFSGLMVTQLVLDDGWIGLALGPAHPERVAWRSSTPR